MKAYQYIPLFVLMAAAALSLTAQTANQNYIKVKSMRNDTGTEFVESIQYFDGLGRPIQTIQKGITPNKQDLVTYQEYDGIGRESKSWLPSVATGNNGAFVSLDNVKAKALATYADSAYSRPVYEASPLSRVLGQYGPGKEWYNNKKAVRTAYLTNSGPDAKLICAQYEIIETVKLKKTKNYDLHQLFVTEMTDEDGNLSYEFKDKLGQVILTRQINNNVNHDTYYVYDDFGNLCFVLPPLATDALAATNVVWTEATQAIMDYAYLYQYDADNRCIKKKLPGCDWEKFVYDKADRLIFSQDGEQRIKPAPESVVTQGRWSFNIYDALGRIVLVGESENATINGVVKGEYQKDWPYHFGYNMSGLGFSWNHCKLYTISYYDNYDFLERAEFKNLGYDARSGYAARYGDNNNKIAAKGLLTGTATALLDGSDKFIYTAYYYDERGRVIQTKSTNHLGGTDSEYIAYNFTGQPTSKLSIHTATNKTTQTELYTYSYDHAGRPVETKHKLNTNVEVSLAKNEYDDLGRLKKTTAHGEASMATSYAYNVRSWTTLINSSVFSQKIYYNGGGFPMFYPKYNGNIGGIITNDLYEYDFTYDGLSRLTGAEFYDSGFNRYDSYSASYSYDKHGNVKTIKRMSEIPGESDACIDNLTFDYNGNQLLKVEDKADNVYFSPSEDFKNYTSQAIEYSFNLNGAMTKNLNKGISSIQYNSLNLPYIMEIKSPVAEARNEYIYSASGEKLRTVQKWNPNYQSNPIIGTSVNNSLLTSTKTADYVGNKVYENGSIKRILIQNGYIENGKYFFYIKDYLGNNRIVFNESNTEQINDFYPFGMAFINNMENELQPYKFGDKEFDTMHGLNQYDFHARQYDPAVIRFTTIDPLAEKYYSWSPYAYCMNNPIKYIDPTGKWIVGTNGKAVNFSQKTGWSKNASIDVMIVGNSMMLSKTATKQLNTMLNSSSEITITLSPNSLKDERGNTVLGRTNEVYNVVKGEEDKISYEMTIYQGSIEKGINMTDSQADKAGKVGAKYKGLDITEGIAATAAHEAVHTQQNNITNSDPNYDPEKEPRKVENKVLDELLEKK